MLLFEFSRHCVSISMLRDIQNRKISLRRVHGRIFRQFKFMGHLFICSLEERVMQTWRVKWPTSFLNGDQMRVMIKLYVNCLRSRVIANEVIVKVRILSKFRKYLLANNWIRNNSTEFVSQRYEYDYQWVHYARPT